MRLAALSLAALPFLAACEPPLGECAPHDPNRILSETDPSLSSSFDDPSLVMTTLSLGFCGDLIVFGEYRLSPDDALAGTLAFGSSEAMLTISGVSSYQGRQERLTLTATFVTPLAAPASATSVSGRLRVFEAGLGPTPIDLAPGEGLLRLLSFDASTGTVIGRFEGKVPTLYLSYPDNVPTRGEEGLGVTFRARVRVTGER